MNLPTKAEDRYKYKMMYKYDEAGNRTRKQIYKSRLGEETWTLYNDEVYIRDAIGNETAVYENSNLQYINIWSAGLEGKVRKDDRGNNIFSYYHKDHLGSITAVMDGASGTITQAQDYDARGDICRSYSTTDTTVNKFTGKERDQETGYDYFGARYYDSRVSVWLSPDPLFEKHIGWSSYNYVLRNPFVLIDPDGRQVHFSDEEKSRNLELNRYKHLLPEKYRQNIGITVNEKNEYILDHDLLLKANIGENEGVYINFIILLYLSSSSQMTNARFVNKEDLFVANIVNPRATINTSLSIMEKDLNNIYHGYTFVSNTVDNDQKPLFFSSCEDVNEIYIPLEDSELEQTKSLGHELDHVYRYLNNLNWKNEESNEFLNRELKNIESIIEKNY